MNITPETNIDGYKADHRRQYTEGTEQVVSNLTPRKTRRPNTSKVVFFGLQYFLKEYLIKAWNENFFSKPIEEVSARFLRRFNNYTGPESTGGDQHIRDLHELGYLPVAVLALPEGTEYPIRVPSSVFYATDKRFGWLTNYFETIFSTTIWGPCTSATTAHQYKKLLKKYALETVGSDAFVPWQGHDFSFRGMFGLEAACMSGAGHLISFTGTDTIPAIGFLEEYYNADCEKELIGGSVPATEHSVMCSSILATLEALRAEHPMATDDALMDVADVITIRRLIKELYPTGIVSIVADSFDYWNTITNTARILKDDIMSRDGKTVFRPDTGDPVKIVCGIDTKDLLEEDGRFFRKGKYISHEDQWGKEVWGTHEKGEEVTAAEIKGSIECLWDIFGGTVSEQGYKVLDPHVGLIYGDSITLERAEAICEGLKKKGFASTNIVFGIGSYTYQMVTRDTDGYAVKATYCEVNGKPINIYKDPKTDDGTKKSAYGLTAVFKDSAGEFYLKDRATWDELLNCEFVKVFENGKLLKDYTLGEVRENLAKYA